MAVRFEWSGSRPGGSGRSGAFWACDTCGKKIVGSGDALLVTDAHGNPTGRFLTVHRGCESEQTRRYPRLDLASLLRELAEKAAFERPDAELHALRRLSA